MNVHHNARLTARGRERMVRALLARQLSVQTAARQVGLSERSVRKWLARSEPRAWPDCAIALLPGGMFPSVTAVPAQGKRKKLLEEVRDLMRLRHYSIRTDLCYCD